MSFFRIEPARNKLRVVFFDGPDAGVFEQLIAVVHFDTKWVEGIDNLRRVGDDRIFFARKFGQEMAFNFIE